MLEVAWRYPVLRLFSTVRMPPMSAEPLWTERDTPGVEVPIPRRFRVLSQKKVVASPLNPDAPSENWTVVRIAMPTSVARYVVEKGSITVDGVSLTVSGLGQDDNAEHWFEISLIPTTLDLTTLGRSDVGTPVNLEVDVIAKYVERLLESRQ